MFIKKLYNLFLQLLFPVNCIICNEAGTYLCKNCFKELKIKNLKHKNKKYLDDIFIASSYQDNVLKKIIITFKYKYIKELGYKLGEFLSLYFNAKLSTLFFSNKKLYNILINSKLTYIPSKNKTETERGFCQSEILMNEVANNCGLNIISSLKIKNKRKRQASLNKHQREKNIINSFQILNKKTKNRIQNKNIIIIDDVITTGSTINEAAKILKENGANLVFALIVAKNN